MSEEKVLYEILPGLTKDGKVRVHKIRCCEIDFEEGLYWPDRSGAGDEEIGDAKSTIPEALSQAAVSLGHDIRITKQKLASLEKQLETIKLGIDNPTLVVLDKPRRR